MIIKNTNWSGLEFSDPENHNEDEFIYLVHGVVNDDLAKILQQKSNSIEGVIYRKGYTDTKRKNRNLEDKEIISCSLIGTGKINGIDFNVSQTFSNVGYILKVPYQNIIYSSIEDLGIDYLEYEEAIKKYANIEDEGPINLLLNTKEDDWNEVLVRGTTEYGSVKILGIFINYCNQDIDYHDILEAANLSRKTNKPIIKLFEGKTYIERRSR